MAAVSTPAIVCCSSSSSRLSSQALTTKLQLSFDPRKRLLEMGIGLLASSVIALTPLEADATRIEYYATTADPPCEFSFARSGLGYCDLAPGSGVEAPYAELINVHYTARFADGTVFDSSYKRGRPLTMRVGVGKVVKGLDQGILGGDGVPPMLVGGKRKLQIPPELAYGPEPAGCFSATQMLMKPRMGSSSSSSTNRSLRSSKINSNNAERPRSFDSKAKSICWEKAKMVPGRDPERWRKDAAGNIVCKRFFNCQGCLCFEYDHIHPFSKGGESVAHNCQILQTRVNRFKSDKENMDTNQLRGYSCDVKFTAKELDVIEMAVYGDVVRPGNQCRCKTVAELLGEYKPKDDMAACKLP